MSSILSHISRVLNLYIAQSSAFQIARVNLYLFRIQTQLSSGRAVLRRRPAYSRVSQR